MRYRLMHISDLHAGPPFNPHIAGLVARTAHDIQPDLLVISGDFVQRADFRAQWRVVRAYLQTLPQPQLAVPGNHDVPLFNPLQRLFFPLQRYRHYIARNINPTFTLSGLAVVGICTAHGLTFDNGRIGRRQAAAVTAAFSAYNADTCKIAVMHHPVVDPPGLHRRRALVKSDEAMRLLDRCGVELLLCGHIHVSYVGNTLDVVRDLRQGTIICQSGTTTSKRGYGREQGTNSFNVIEIDRQAIRISQHLYLADVGRFAPIAEHVFPRRSAGVYELPVSERIVEVES